MAVRRKDNKNRNLLDGESQERNGRYRFRYTDHLGVRHTLYSWRLVPTDKTPLGKREDLSLREKETQLQVDIHQGIDTISAQRLTVDDMYLRYMATKTGLKVTTKQNYERIYNSHVKEALGSRKLKNIKYSHIKTFYLYLINEKKLKIGTIENIQTILSPIFELAIRDGYIRTNPTKSVVTDLKKNFRIEKTKRHALSIEEQEIFVNFISNSNYYKKWLPLVTFLLGTGCRIGEALGLTWEDVDFKNELIHVKHTIIEVNEANKSKVLHISTPKTVTGHRDIPLFPEVKKALLEIRQKQMQEGLEQIVIDGYTGFVFTNKTGNVYYRNNVNRFLKNATATYNKQEMQNAVNEHREAFKIRPFSVHNLRHTFCTRFCENETNIKVIQEIMGHSDITTTMNIYAEATKEKKQESFKNLIGKIKIC